MREDLTNALVQYKDAIRVLENHFDDKCPLFSQDEPPHDLTDKWWGITEKHTFHAPGVRPFSRHEVDILLVIGDSVDNVVEKHKSGSAYLSIKSDDAATICEKESYVVFGDSLCAIFVEVEYREYGYYILTRKDRYVSLTLAEAVNNSTL